MIANRTTPSRLDRLSALLAGLRPRIERIPEHEVDTHKPEPSTRDHALRLHLLLPSDASSTSPGLEAPSSLPRLIAARKPTAGKLDDLAQALRLDVHLDGPAAPLFIQEFAEPVEFAVDKSAGALHQIMLLIVQELGAPRCGHDAVLQHAGEILFIGLLRHLTERPGTSQRLFRGLSDQRIARAIVAMHTRPEHPWKLEDLADEASMSRTAFANRFRELVALTPGRYLASLRLAVAENEVRTGGGLKQAARLSGYRNASALSRALSRHRDVT